MQIPIRADPLLGPPESEVTPEVQAGATGESAIVCTFPTVLNRQIRVPTLVTSFLNEAA